MPLKKIAILGSTGSIGLSALSVIRKLPEFSVVGLSAKRNVDLLALQAMEFSPKIVAVASEEEGKALRKNLARTDTLVITGESASIAVATLNEADIVLIAISGAESLLPTLAAIRAGKRIALASKEALVLAGEILMEEAKKSGAEIIPVDSEHSAIFQCLEDRKEPKRVILTASGGPFLNRPTLENISPDEALSHPTWAMGKRITIDSATLMNKGLEVIEAVRLFNVRPRDIEVVIHPEAILHSAVEFSDGTVIACLSNPDMRLAIAYALTYPERSNGLIKPLDLTELGKLSFRKPDINRFPCLCLAYSAIEKGGTMPAVLNAADEVAVEAFLEGKIPFMGIPKLIEGVVSAHSIVDSPNIEEVLGADRWARQKAKGLLEDKVQRTRDEKEEKC
ncbi:MAG: 1-deoxy-D-xylulose-5-phosphate reductoisomerase [bacterium]|nr:1-deoxy-D-xylulose-5-phosphate reductoisomerase [bacterium]